MTILTRCCLQAPVFPPKMGWYPTWFYLPSCVQASCSGGSSPSENGPSVDDLPIQKCHFNSYPLVNMACWKNTPFSLMIFIDFPNKHVKTSIYQEYSHVNIPMTLQWKPTMASSGISHQNLYLYIKVVPLPRLITGGHVKLPEAAPTSVTLPMGLSRGKHTPNFMVNHRFRIPSGKLTVCYWKWQFIVDFPMKNGDFP